MEFVGGGLGRERAKKKNWAGGGGTQRYHGTGKSRKNL